MNIKNAVFDTASDPYDIAFGTDRKATIHGYRKHKFPITRPSTNQSSDDGVVVTPSDEVPQETDKEVSWSKPAKAERQKTFNQQERETTS